jgi:hypothetical protein
MARVLFGCAVVGSGSEVRTVPRTVVETVNIESHIETVDVL